VECLDQESVEQQFFYALTNPVKDGLADCIVSWKGFSSYPALALGEDVNYTYIDRTAWHNAGGKKSKKAIQAFTKTIRLKFTPLPGWENLKPNQRQTKIKRECRALEQKFRQERKETGIPVMSKAKLDKIDQRDRPKTKPKRTPKPLCHASTKEAAKAYKESLREFLTEYRITSAYYRQGFYDIEFPQGSLKPPLMTVQV